jgi:lipoyl(octanoyl) transferase
LTALDAYLLGTVPFETALRLQRQLVYRVGGERASAAVVLCEHPGLGLGAYLGRLRDVLLGVLRDCEVRGTADAGGPDVSVGGRLLAGVGVAVRDWVSYFGAYLNVNPDLTLLRAVHGDQSVTSLERERRGPVRAALVRERLLERLTASFGLERPTLLFSHPAPERAEQHVVQ